MSQQNICTALALGLHRSGIMMRVQRASQNILRFSPLAHLKVN